CDSPRRPRRPPPRSTRGVHSGRPRRRIKTGGTFLTPSPAGLTRRPPHTRWGHRPAGTRGLPLTGHRPHGAPLLTRWRTTHTVTHAESLTGSFGQNNSAETIPT